MVARCRSPYTSIFSTGRPACASPVCVRTRQAGTQTGTPDGRCPKTLRERFRHKVANNSYAKGIVLTLANDTIGTGPRLQMLSDDDEWNRDIEREFSDLKTARPHLRRH